METSRVAPQTTCSEREARGTGLAALVAVLVGTLLPLTRVENERMSEMSDLPMDAAKDTASEAVDREGRSRRRRRVRRLTPARNRAVSRARS